MPTVNWKNASSGLWSDGTQWDTGTAPDDSTDDVVFPAGAYVVVLSQGETYGIDSFSQSGGTLDLDGALILAGGTSTVLNVLVGASGLLEASGGNTVTVGNGSGVLTNDGTVQAEGAGTVLYLIGKYQQDQDQVVNNGTFIASGGAFLGVETPLFSNFSGTTLTGGAYVATGTAPGGNESALAIQTGAQGIVTLDATAVVGNGAEDILAYTGSSFVGLASTLTTIGLSGTLDLAGAQDYSVGASSSPSPLTVSGSVVLTGGTFDTLGGLDLSGTGLLSGTGTVTTNGGTLAGTIEASGGILTVTGAVDATGATVRTDAGATLALHGAVGAVSDAGVLAASGGSLTVNGPVSGAGGLLVENGATLDLAGGETNAISFDGAGTLVAAQPASGLGTLFGFGQGDALVLDGVTGDAASVVGQTLQVTDGGAVVDSIPIAGTYAGASFTATASGGATTISETGVLAHDWSYEGPRWASNTVTWTFAQSTLPGDSSRAFSDIITNATDQSNVTQAFQAWAQASGLTLQYVPTDSASVDIRVGLADLGTGSNSMADTIGLTTYFSPGNANALLPDVTIQLEDPAQYSPGTGDNATTSYAAHDASFEQVALHEIGHSLGLGHSTDTNAVMYPVVQPGQSGLGASDRAAIAALYGEALACFAAGTRIETAHGPVAVEHLAPGETVRVLDGEALPVIWVGHRDVDIARHPDPDLVRPIRVRAGAFGPGRPASDLFVSPDHALCVDGALIPARLLVNGESITRDARAWVRYYHVELPRHAVLFAEGMPAESYLDTGNRHAFAEGAVAPPSPSVRVAGSATGRAAGSCLPFLTSPAEVAPIWRRVAAMRRAA